MQFSGIENKKILITGVSGFIGSSLARVLLENGANVYAFVRSDSNVWRIKDILGKLKISVVDLINENDLIFSVNQIEPQYIFHCAAYGLHNYQSDDKKIAEVNIIGTMNLVKALSNIDFDFFVNTGSCFEYGLMNSVAKEEDKVNPFNMYGISKLATTLYCAYESLKNHKNIVTFRLFSVYGPFDDPTHLIPYCINRCLLNEKVRVTEGEAIRDYIFIDDVIDAYLKVMEVSALPNVINIGYSNKYAIRDVVNKIVELTNSKSRVEWGNMPEREFESKYWVCDNTRAKNFLGWTPKIDLENGLIKTIEWYKKNLKKPFY